MKPCRVTSPHQCVAGRHTHGHHGRAWAALDAVAAAARIAAAVLFTAAGLLGLWFLWLAFVLGETGHGA